MLRKIITYFLIVAVVSPLIISSAFSVGVKRAYAEYSHTNSRGYKVDRTSISMGDGALTQYEDSYVSDSGDTYKRIGTQKNGEGINWGQTTKNSQSGDYSEESDFDSLSSSMGNSKDGSSGDSGAGTGSVTTAQQYTKELESPCSFVPPRLGANCVGYLVSQVLYYTVFSPSYYVALMAGGIFNASIGFSLSGESFPTSEGSMIATGWKMVRDLLNLFFIFILLYVAISTIIQYGSFGKDTIVKIIVAAVLINFSLMMTKMVIDSSHILAWGFYDKIEERAITDKDGNKTTAPIIPEEIVVKGIKTKNLAGVFMSGFNPQRLLIPSNTTKASTDKSASAAMADGSGIIGVIWQAILIMGLASVLNFVVAFILFAGAIMFIIRVVVLWFLLLFSPLAFAGLIMPAFKQYSSKWWDALIKQAFFAPAFLFLFYLVTMMVNSGFLDAVIKGYKNAPSAAILFFDPGSTIVVFFHFFVIGALLVGCLYLAQQMGAHGAGAMMKFGNNAGDWARNKFGDKAAWRGTKYGLRYGGGVAGDSNWFKNTIGRIPGGNILGRKLGAMKKADEDKARKAAEKSAGTLSKAGRKSLDIDKERGFLGRLAYGGGVSKVTREGYEKVIAKKDADEYEEKRYYKNLATLADIKDYIDSMGKVVTGGDTVKSMMKRGKEEELDKLIEGNTKKIENSFKNYSDRIAQRIIKIETELNEKGIDLFEAKRRSLPQADIEIIKNKIINLQVRKNAMTGEKIVIDKKEKEREVMKKAVEKYEAKQDTEKLGAKFSSSGAGGGGGKGGGSGGGKTTP